MPVRPSAAVPIHRDDVESPSGAPAVLNPDDPRPSLHPPAAAQLLVEHSAPPGLVLQARGLLRGAHRRTWRLGAGATVLLLLLVTLWTATRQPRFVPPGPPAWLTAEPTPAPASSITLDTPASSATAATEAREALPSTPHTTLPQATAAGPSPPAASPAPRSRPAPRAAAPPSEFKTVFH